MIKQANYIPVQNNLKKAMAFAPAMEPDYFTKHRMVQPKGFINPVETIERLQDEGWFLESVAQKLNSDRRAESVQARLYHPDITMRKPSGVIEGTSNLYVSSNMRKANTELSLGMYRLVCSNGLVAFDAEHFNVKSQEDIDLQLQRIEEEANTMIKQFNNLKEIELSEFAQRDLAKQALATRFSGGVIDHMQLLNCHRDEDKGNDVWHVYNRLQENLIKPGMLKDRQGHNIVGVYDIDQNIRVNTALYSKVVLPFLKN